MTKDIKIYIINNDGSIFQDDFSIEYLRTKKIVFINNIFLADILLSSSVLGKKIKLLRKVFYFKKKMIWTNEPKYSKNYKNFKSNSEIIMNVFSKNVFVNNLHFLGSYHFDFANNLGISLKTKKLKPYNERKLCVAVYAYKNPKESRLLISDVDISLNKYRQDLAMYMYEKDKIDIIGSGWPEGVKVAEESGFDSGNLDWWTSKLNTLEHYKFNICIENTAYPYYCTEKIWHAIKAGCLPVYYGKNTSIYETFPEDSFVDASKFESFQQLLDFIENLSEANYIKRYNKCLDVFETQYNFKMNSSSTKTELIDLFIENVNNLNN